MYATKTCRGQSGLICVTAVLDTIFPTCRVCTAELAAAKVRPKTEFLVASGTQDYLCMFAQISGYLNRTSP